MRARARRPRPRPRPPRSFHARALLVLLALMAARTACFATTAALLEDKKQYIKEVRFFVGFLWEGEGRAQGTNMAQGTAVLLEDKKQYFKEVGSYRKLQCVSQAQELACSQSRWGHAGLRRYAQRSVYVHARRRVPLPPTGRRGGRGRGGAAPPAHRLQAS